MPSHCEMIATTCRRISEELGETCPGLGRQPTSVSWLAMTLPERHGCSRSFSGRFRGVNADLPNGTCRPPLAPTTRLTARGSPCGDDPSRTDAVKSDLGAPVAADSGAKSRGRKFGWRALVRLGPFESFTYGCLHFVSGIWAGTTSNAAGPRPDTTSCMGTIGRKAWSSSTSGASVSPRSQRRIATRDCAPRPRTPTGPPPAAHWHKSRGFPGVRGAGRRLLRLHTRHASDHPTTQLNAVHRQRTDL